MDLLLLVHAEVRAPMRHIAVILHKRPSIKEKLQSLSSRQLMIGMLPINPLLAATQQQVLVDLLPPLLEGLLTCSWSTEASPELLEALKIPELNRSLER